MIYAHQLAALKRDAKARAKHNSRLTPDEHQDQIARENGYSTWAVMMRQVESTMPLPENTQRAHGS